MISAQQGQSHLRRSIDPRSIVAWVGSVSAHVAVLISGFFIVWLAQSPKDLSRKDPVIVSFESPSPMGAAGQIDGLQKASPAEAVSRVDLAIDLPTPTQILQTQSPVIEPLMRSDLPDHALIAESRDLPDVRLFGLGTSNAESIVYVVDASGSMVSSLPIVLGELHRSVRRLAPTQRFQVIFFTGSAGSVGYIAAPHPADDDPRITRLIRALPDNVDRVFSWSRSIIPSGRSNPIEALEVALSLKPDAIFLLSSALTGIGEWEPDRAEILRQLDRLNPRNSRTGRRATSIKTIQFLDNDPSGILRAIGEAHGGLDGHDFISREELKLK